MIRAHDRGDITQGGAAAEWVIGIVRRSFHGLRDCIVVPRNLTRFLAELETVSALFRAAHETMLGLQGAGLVVAPPEALNYTCHERSATSRGRCAG